MRVAMMTLNVYDNYGNMLQKYALYRTLKKFADSVEVLWHPATKPFYPYKLELEQQAEGNLRQAVFRGVREYKLKQFNDANMVTRFDITYLEELADEYDYFVVGSDQVWNPEFSVPGRFLEFAPREKRIAYAASIVIPELPKNVQGAYKKKILEIPHVSVREKEGCDLVEKLTGKRPLQVVDPVFLLTADEWRAIAKRPPWLDKKIYDNGYLMTYFLSGTIPEQVNRLANKLGLPVINMLDKNNFEHYITGIEEFIYLLDHATILCTYSFHGTAFANIFKKPFIVYRVGKLRTTRFSRLGSLLEMFGLSDRVSDMALNINLDDPLKIDFTRREEVLPLERKKAFNFLANALWK
ncbi:MAG: polysaccharide pyruvyl transferase family protein [Selenomonadaceae bacterium]|nr:polysaccharide pyruvyl transferase family protein [Selenomonadaceae bacterium]